MEVVTYGGTGDSDLYVRQGDLPTDRLYDARSAGEDTAERIAVDRPRRGNWYILVRGFREYKGVTLAVRLDREGDDEGRVTPLSNGAAVRDLSGGRESWRYFSIRVPAGAGRLTIRTGGGRGDCDLYVSRGPLPTPKSHSYSSTGESTEESILIRRPEAGVWYILLHGATAYAGVDLVAGYDGTPEAGTAEILEPTRWTVWRTGGEYTIRWQTGPEVRRVQVQYSLDGGRTWALGDLPRVAPAEPGVMAIRVLREKRFVTEEARIRILDFDRETVLATSGSFRITWGEREPVPLPPRPPPGPLVPVVPLPSPAELRADRHEPDGDAQSAGLLRLDSPQAHTIYPKGDQDWLEFHPSSAGPVRAESVERRYGLRFSAVSVPLEVKVWSVGPRGQEQRLGTYEAGRPGGLLRLEPQRDTRYFRIRVTADSSNDGDGIGAYTISVAEDGASDIP
jgi:hypothetical protein